MNLGKKFLALEEAYVVARVLRSFHIHTAGQFIIGYPGEDEQDVRSTLSYANALPLDERHIHIAMPLPGTPMHETCVKNNWLAEDANHASYKTPVISTPMLKRERLYALWLADREQALRRKA